MTDREDRPQEDPELTSQERRGAAADRAEEKPPRKGKRRRRLAYTFSLLGIIAICGVSAVYLVISRGGGEEFPPDGTPVGTIAPDRCLPIRVVDAELRALEDEDLIHAWVYVFGNYLDWPPEGPGDAAGYITLQIEDQTWTWSHVWVGTNPPSGQQPFRVGDGFRPIEIGPDFVQALEEYGWENLNFALTITNNCGETQTFLQGFDPDISTQVTPKPDIPSETF